MDSRDNAGTAPRGKHTVGSGWSRVILMSSRFKHGDDAKRLGVLVEAATEEWNRSLRAVEAGVLQLSLTRAPRLLEY